MQFDDFHVIWTNRFGFYLAPIDAPIYIHDLYRHGQNNKVSSVPQSVTPYV